MKQKYMKVLSAILVCATGLWILATKCVAVYYDREMKREMKSTAMESVHLPDNMLEDAVLRRIQDKYIKSGDLNSMLDAMTDVERNVFIASYFDKKVKKGGLCSFLLDCPEMGSYILKTLKELKAEEYKKLLADFTAKNAIKLSQIGKGKDFRQYDYNSLYQEYPFEKFDRQYEELEKESGKELGEFITQYIYDNMVSL